MPTSSLRRRNRLVPWLSCLALLLGPVATLHAGLETWRFEIEGQERSVRVHTPDAATAAPPPLVIVFHGLGDSSSVFADAVRFHREWPDAIVAYPNGMPRPDREGKRGWQTQRGQYNDRDLQLVDRLLVEAVERHGVKPETTYVAGFSNGGHMTLLLLAERPHAFASFAVIGSVRPDLAGATTPKPLIYLWGREEPPNYSGQWAETIEAMTRLNRTTGGLRDYATCCKLQAPGAGGAPLVFGLYNAGHVWPHRGNEWVKKFFKENWRPVADSD